jgi:putative transposase
MGKQPQSAREAENDELTRQIKEIQGKVRQRYGSPWITAERKRRGRHVGRHRVARILHGSGLGSRRKKRFRVTTRSTEEPGVAPNRLDRCFTVPPVNQVWVSGHHQRGHRGVLDVPVRDRRPVFP